MSFLGNRPLFDKKLALHIDQKCERHYTKLFRFGGDNKDYIEAMNDLMPLVEKCSVIHSRVMTRIDHRTLGEFAVDIARQSEFEKRDTHRWLKGLTAERKSLRYNGMGRNGAVIVNPDRVNGNPDWKLSVKGCPLLPDGDHLVETKHAEFFGRGQGKPDKLSFKIADLERYLRQRACVLVILGDYRDPAAPLQWDLLTPARIAKLLDRAALGTFKEFGGGKPSVRLTGEALYEFLDPKDLLPV